MIEIERIKLSTSIVEKQGCKKIIFNDTTGTYNSITNPTGYTPSSLYTPGSPNVSLVASVKLIITRPDNLIVTIDLWPKTGVNPANFVTYISALNYEITAALLGYTAQDVITSGYYTFKYRVEFTDGTVKHNTKSVFIKCELECCVQNKFGDVIKLKTICAPICEGNTLDDALFMFSLLKAIEYEARCNSNKSEINELINKLKTMCDQDCGCGC
jgi:hypothetical protein